MRTILVSLLLFIFNFCLAQPQWKFHIAFEDSIGAKDTLWMIWDTTAHGSLPTDTALGEGPANFNYNEFNVWFYNWDGDSTKTRAYPYNAISFLIEVRAFNYQYPITIRWDTSLFHAPYLPLPVGYINRAIIDNDYFFFVNNNGIYHTYNMLIDNSAFAPEFFWGSQSQFPMTFYIAKDPFLNVAEIQESQFEIYPNPFQNELSITMRANTLIKTLEIFSINGKKVYFDEFDFAEKVINIETKNFHPGLYILKVINHQNQISYEKIIKLP